MRYKVLFVLVNIFTCFIASAEDDKTNSNYIMLDNIHKGLLEITEYQKKNQDYNLHKINLENKKHEEIVSKMDDLNKNLIAISIKLSEAIDKINDSNKIKEKVAISNTESLENKDLQLKSN